MNENNVKPTRLTFNTHVRSKEWSKKNTVKPSDVSCTSSKKYLFNCLTCKHEYSLEINKITNRNVQCGYCTNRRLCQDGNCVVCFEKSLASHEYGYRWSAKNPKPARQMFKLCDNYGWFYCDTCNHDYKNRMSRGYCPYCAHQKLCDKKKCKPCFNRSFASHPKARFWSKSKNNVTPRQIFKVTGAKHVFKCPYCIKYYSSKISNVANGKWCTCRVNKTESKLFKYLSRRYPNVQKNAKFDWCKNIRHLPFDFYIPEYNLLIELDGGHHFENVKYYSRTFQEVQERDIIKMKLANKHKLSVIRICQIDVWNDRNDWKTKLKSAIRKIKNEGCTQNISIGKIYEKHKCYTLELTDVT